MANRYIYYDQDIYVVTGIGQVTGKGLCFTVIELKFAQQLPNDNIPSLKVPVKEAIEITKQEMLDTLRLLYER